MAQQSVISGRKSLQCNQGTEAESKAGGQVVCLWPNEEIKSGAKRSEISWNRRAKMTYPRSCETSGSWKLCLCDVESVT